MFDSGHIISCYTPRRRLKRETKHSSRLWFSDTRLIYQRYWCEHKPSITISVKDDEWLEVGSFVYKHFDEISGVSFLPYSDHSYQQAPYQEITKEEYTVAAKLMPAAVDWEALNHYEQEDNTVAMQTMACSGDTCEIVDLT